MKVNGWLFVAASLMLTGCVNDDGSKTQAGEEVAKESDPRSVWNPMLRHYADNLIIPTYQNVLQHSEELTDANGPLAAYCELIGTSEEMDALAQAQQMWRETMAAWQQAELYQLGPLSSNGGALRNRIYSYSSNAPLSECAVDQSVILAQSDDFNIATRSSNSRGLDSLEYLLFNDDLAHQCAPQVSITENWNALPEADRKAQRCAYALQVAEDVNQASQTLVDAWQTDNGNYRFEFLHPSYIEDHLKALSDALFYIETHTKDLKVGIPAGIHANCLQVVCKEGAESRYSQTAFANIRNNLQAFRAMLMGGEGPGFDDVIIDAGFAGVIEQFNTDIDLALAIISNSRTSLYQQLVEIEQSGDHTACDNAAANPDVSGGIEVCRLHGALKRITDRLRTDFVGIVNVDLPDRAQSDND